MSNIKIYWKQLESLIVHKWRVSQAGYVIGIPIWKLIVHDWSKFTPFEFFRYARWKYGDATNEEWAAGWLDHLHKNAHHPEYWVLSWHGNPNFYSGIGQHIAPYVSVLPMPESSVREMIADMHGTSKQVTGEWDIAKWLNENGPLMHLHDDTIALMIKIMKEIGYKLSDWSWEVGYHRGDPCIYCDVGHDHVEVGPCPGTRIKEVTTPLAKASRLLRNQDLHAQ